jgi:hypothetical protein
MPVPTTVSEPGDTVREEVLDDPDDDPALRCGSLAHHLVNAAVVVGQKERNIFVLQSQSFPFVPQEVDPVVDVTAEQVVVIVGKARQKDPDSPRLLLLEVL